MFIVCYKLKPLLRSFNWAALLVSLLMFFFPIIAPKWCSLQSPTSTGFAAAVRAIWELDLKRSRGEGEKMIIIINLQLEGARREKKAENKAPPEQWEKEKINFPQMKLNCVCFIIGCCDTFPLIFIVIKKYAFAPGCEVYHPGRRIKSAFVTHEKNEKRFQFEDEDDDDDNDDDEKIKTRIKTNLSWLSELFVFMVWHDVESSLNCHRRLIRQLCCDMRSSCLLTEIKSPLCVSFFCWVIRTVQWLATWS